MEPVALAADRTRILEADVTLTVLAALTTGADLEAWLHLGLAAEVVALDKKKESRTRRDEMMSVELKSDLFFTRARGL